MLVSIAVLGGLLIQLRQQAMGGAERLVRSFAQIVEEQTGHTFRAAGTLFGTIAARINSLDPVAAADAVAVSASLRRLIADLPAFSGVWVLGLDGRVIYDGRDSFGMDLSDREYFQIVRDNPDKAVQVGAPVRSRVSDAWIVPVVAPWRRPDGTFAGVIVLAVQSRQLEQVWRVEDAGDSRSIGLLRRDGILLLRNPYVEGATGQRLSGMRLFSEALASADSGTIEEISPLDGKHRLIGFRRMAANPDLVIVASEAVDEVAAAWWRTLWIVVVGWIVASTMLALLGLSLRREWRRRRDSEAGLAAANAVLEGEIADRRRAEEAAVAARTRLTDAIAVFPGSFRLFDADERLVLANGVEWLENAPGPLPLSVGMTITDMVTRAADLGLDTAAAGRREAWIEERLAQFRLGRTDAELHWADGRWFHLLERRTSDGGWVSIRLDITAQKLAEEQLRQAQKMDAIGQLTGGIAHDFNNMLTVIIGNSELLAERADAAPEVRAGLDLVLRAAEAAAELTGRLLAFARRTPLQPRRVQVNPFITQVEVLLRRSLGEQYDIHLALAPGMWDVLIDPAQLEAAILNLALNARDAMADGGPVTIETANIEIDEAYAAANEDAQPGQFIMVAISDAGAGMPAEVVRRAFEPFFTTKPVGKGTGLGLSMVYGFVRQSGGHVKIYSEEGRGTTIRLYLPRAIDDVAASDTLVAEQHLPRGENRTVLVVEDDDLVRRHVEAQLDALGYRVLGAENGPAALARLEAGEAVDLLLTDVVMPGGMTGREVATAAQRLRPGLPVLFMSGYTENAIVHGGRLDPDARLLSKPYRLRDLAAKVHAALTEA
ncbi:hypothetical protein STHU_01590 [Allostella humosa]|uniref:ATP-binding protein n=1 Tax=Stella humosa TaxID=94 RepID=UPI00113A5BD9|nr:ATP-binding protein [Stella humosa]BBK29525.1 hypothetical protein STHU_01590 [Stella humosa]